MRFTLVALFLTTALMVAQTPQPHGVFTGTLKITPVGDGVHWKLLEPYSYTDPTGKELDAPAGFSTDGASIPRPLWSIVGSPFTGKYVGAAVVHDVGCVNHKYSWQATHRIFYEAMIDLGVDPDYAKLLYYGVRFGGPKWTYRTQAAGCRGCKTATRQIVIVKSPEITKSQLDAFQKELKARDAAGNPITVDEIEDLTPIAKGTHTTANTPQSP
jgi:hypothetical protein